MGPSGLLDGIVERVQRAAAARPVVVFDLDGTLFLTESRNLTIFAEAADEFPELRPALARRAGMLFTWNIKQDLRDGGLTDEGRLERIMEFWKTRFFKNEYLLYDDLVPGAVQYVRRIHEAGATVCYLTGRDEPGMGPGTIAALRQHGFPWGEPRVELIMKATFEETDESHKRRALDCVRALGPVVAAFDNEPELINLLADAFPAATVVRVDSLHSPKPIAPYPHIPAINDFLTVSA